MTQPAPPSLIPTAVLPESGSHKTDKTYLNLVMAGLRDLGSDFPDADIEASGDLWSRCQNAGISPRDCAAHIYFAEHHRHHGDRTTVHEPPTPTPGGKVGEPVAVIHEPSAAASAGSEASEQVTVVHEGAIPFVRVTRDAQLHALSMEVAARVGPMDTTEHVYRFLAPRLEKEDQEVFLVLALNLRCELKTPPYEIARGQRSSTVVGVEDVMRAVLESGCEGFVVAHNHPSGIAKPSKADRDLTRQIQEATKPFGKGVALLDHVVIGSGCCFSILENKLYRFPVEPAKPSAATGPRSKKRRAS